MSSNTLDERRRFTRIEFGASATISQGDTALPVALVDVSLNGVLVETPDEYSLKSTEPAFFKITLSEDVHIEMKVHLVHSSHHVLGFQCESIDMDSVSHLRRLIELNIDAENASERVLEELLQPH